MWSWWSERNAGISGTDFNLPKCEGESVEYLVFQIEKKLNNSGVKFFYAFRFLKVIFMILHVYGCKTCFKNSLKVAYIKLVLVLHEVRISISFRKKTGVCFVFGVVAVTSFFARLVLYMCIFPPKILGEKMVGEL